MSRKDYQFEYQDKIRDLDEAQMIADNVCNFIGLDFVTIGYGFGVWGNNYTYNMNRDRDPYITLNETGLNIGTLSHELAHHFEYTHCNYSTHSRHHKAALKLIQIYIKYCLRRKP